MCEAQRGGKSRGEPKRIMGAVGEMKSSSKKCFVYLAHLGPVLLFTGDNKNPCNEMRA